MSDQCRTVDERGSALLLVPAGILIVLVLTAITVDASLGFMAERSAANIASSAANDMVSLGIDIEHFRDTGKYRLAGNLETAIAGVSANAQAQAGDLFIPGTFAMEINVVDPVNIEVVARGQVERLIMSSLTSGPFQISARAIGTADAIP